MRRAAVPLVLSTLVLFTLAGCGSKGGDVAGPNDDDVKTGVLTADVNGRGWASVDAAGRPIAECYLYLSAEHDTILHIVALRRVAGDTLQSGIFIDLPKAHLGSIALRDTSTATWFVERMSGADTLRAWYGTGLMLGGTAELTRWNVAADSAYGTFAFEAITGPEPDTVRVTNGRFALPYADLAGPGDAARQAGRQRARRR